MMPSPLNTSTLKVRSTMETERFIFTFRVVKTGEFVEVITKLDVSYAKNLALDVLNENCQDSIELIDISFIDN